MIVYKSECVKLNKGQAKKIISFLRGLAKTACPIDEGFGICSNLSDFLNGINVGYGFSGYGMVSDLALGFPNVELDRLGNVSSYPLGNENYHKDAYSKNLWVKGNRRTELCTHMANRLQELLQENLMVTLIMCVLIFTSMLTERYWLAFILFMLGLIIIQEKPNGQV